MWQVGDWCIFNLRIVQILKLENGDDTWDEVSDGSIRSYGKLRDRFRQLTLQNKSIIESFQYYYDELRKFPGSRGFNYPSISKHFEELALRAIDGDREAHDAIRVFVNAARQYQPVIQGISLF